MQALQLFLSLSILVLIHELGHFTFAKLSKTRVDKFYLFFNPWFSLFKFKKGETTYGIGWLPLGGYCKIAGMVDESMDSEQLKNEPQPWEYRAKPLGQRFLIISGGVIFNFILAFIIYSAVLFTWGKKELPIENVTYGIYCDSLALDAGLQHGDIVLQVGDQKPERVADVISGILIEDATTIKVRRDGKITDINLPADIKSKLMQQQNPMFVVEFIPFIVDSVMAGSAAEKAKLRKDDKIVAINDIQTPAFFDFVKEVQNFKGQDAEVTIVRNGYTDTIPVTFSADGKLGAYRKGLSDIYEYTQIEYSLLESIPAGISMGLENLMFYVKQLKLVFTKEGSQQLGSFVSMGKLYDTNWNWQWFWMLTALFSIIIGFMNILPIPALDGGHLLFLIYEFITGKKPSNKFLEKAQMIGMAIVLTLFMYALINDIGRL